MKRFFLIAILAVALLLRIVAVTNVPPGLSNDEISIAYNAYSVLKTGKDEYGKSFPVSFRSHDTYKAPLYIYLSVPSLAVLGNNEMAVRLPSILLGTLTVLALYLLVYELTGNKQLSLASSLFLAISPWHIYTSRVALESNASLFFVVLGVYLFLLSINKNRKLLFLSMASFAMSMYAYHTEWVFSPLILLSMLFLYREKLTKNKSLILKSLAFFVLLLLPLAVDTITRSGGGREKTEFLLNDFVLNSLFVGKSVFQKVFITFEFWARKYFGYLSLGYLFFRGLEIVPSVDSLKFGLFYAIQLSIYLYGLYLIFRQRPKGGSLLVAWLVLGPLIPSFTEGEMNLVRNLVSVVPVVIISAFGLYYLWQKTRSFNLRAVYVLALVVNMIFVGHQYFSHFSKELSENWSYGFKQIASFVAEQGGKYDHIIIDPEYGTESPNLVGVPHLFILYFNSFDPQEYLETSKLTAKGLSFAKYDFRKVDWPKEEINPRSLYVVGVLSFPVEGERVKEIYSINLLNGKKAFKFYESF